MKYKKYRLFEDLKKEHFNCSNNKSDLHISLYGCSFDELDIDGNIIVHHYVANYENKKIPI